MEEYIWLKRSTLQLSGLRNTAPLGAYNRDSARICIQAHDALRHPKIYACHMTGHVCFFKLYLQTDRGRAGAGVDSISFSNI